METILGYVIGSAILTAMLYPFLRMSLREAAMPSQEDVDKEKLWGQADALCREGAAWVVIVYKDYSDSWIRCGRYLPVGHDDEVLPRSYCVLGDFPMSRDALPEKLREIALDELNEKCRFVFADDYTQLVRDGWGNWRFVRRDGKLLLVWQLTGYGEKERREREREREREEQLFQSACMD